MKKILPKMTSDEDAENILEQDLSDYLNEDNFKSVSFEFKPKNKTINLRVPEELLEKVKTVSQKEGIPYQRYIRRAIEQSLGE
jgi:predicted DNA binding CopG/RHH family protein